MVSLSDQDTFKDRLELLMFIKLLYVQSKSSEETEAHRLSKLSRSTRTKLITLASFLSQNENAEKSEKVDFVTCMLEAKLALYDRLGEQKADEKVNQKEEKKRAEKKKAEEEFKVAGTAKPKKQKYVSSMKNFIKQQRGKLGVNRPSPKGKEKDLKQDKKETAKKLLQTIA